MRRIIWIAIIASILVTWGLYTWVNPVRGAIDSFFVNAVFPTVGGAFASLHTAVVTSPFWMTYIAPWDWLISGCLFAIATMIIFWKAPIIKQRVKTKTEKTYIGGPESVPPTVLKQPAKSIEVAEPAKEPAPQPVIEKEATA